MSTRAPQGVGERMRLLGDTLRLVRLLAAGRWTIDDLTRETGLHRRTLYRLLAALRRAGLRVPENRAGGRVYRSLVRADVETWLWPPLRHPRSKRTRSGCAYCPRPMLAHGLCSTHLMRQRKGQPLDTPVRGGSVVSAETVEAAIILGETMGDRPAARVLGLSRNTVQNWVRRKRRRRSSLNARTNAIARRLLTVS